MIELPEKQETKLPETARNGISIDILDDYARIKYKDGPWISTHIAYVKNLLAATESDSADNTGLDFTLPFNCKKLKLAKNKDLTVYIWCPEKTQKSHVKEKAYEQVHFPNLIIKISLRYNESKKIWGMNKFYAFACERPEYSVNWALDIPEKQPGVFVYNMLNFYQDGSMCIGSNVLPQSFTSNLQSLGVIHSIITDSAFSWDLNVRNLKEGFYSYANPESFMNVISKGKKYPFYMMSGHPCSTEEEYASYVANGFKK